jgi:hypothetical protein
LVFCEQGKLAQERALGIGYNVCSDTPTSEYHCVVVKLGYNAKDIADILGRIEVSEHGFRYTKHALFYFV